jgi:hypothetical protein
MPQIGEVKETVVGRTVLSYDAGPIQDEGDRE